MLQKYRNIILVKKLLFPIISSNKKSVEIIEELFSLAQNNIEVSTYHSGYTPIPVFTKIESDIYRFSNIYISNDKHQLKELKIYFRGDYVFGFEIREDLESLNFDTLDFSNMIKEQNPTNKYFKRYVNLEGFFDETLYLFDFVDDESMSKEYVINGIKLYSIIIFDDNRCICINEKREVFKVNFKVPIVQKKAGDLDEFEKKLFENNTYIFELFGD